VSGYILGIEFLISQAKSHLVLIIDKAVVRRML
jgi:hypothetical protein